MAITRITAQWTGFSGAPGYTNFFFDAFGGGDSVELEAARVRSFFLPLAPILPTSVTINVQPEAAILDEEFGGLLDYAAVSEPLAPVLGGGSGTYSAPAGAAVSWMTNSIARGRRLRGRTFIVPLAGGAYDAQGTLSTSALSAMQTGINNLIGTGDGPQLVIWSRPRGSDGGSIGPVTSGRIADRVAVLRSRRD